MPYAARVVGGQLGGDQGDAREGPAAQRQTRPRGPPSRRRPAGTTRARLRATRPPSSTLAPHGDEQRRRSAARGDRPAPARTSSSRPLSSSARVCRPTRNMLISPATIAPKAVACQATWPPTVLSARAGPAMATKAAFDSIAGRGPVELGLGRVEPVDADRLATSRGRCRRAPTTSSSHRSRRRNARSRMPVAGHETRTLLMLVLLDAGRRSGAGTAPRAWAAGWSAPRTPAPARARERSVEARRCRPRTAPGRPRRPGRGRRPGPRGRAADRRSSAATDVRVRWRSSARVPVSTARRRPG